MKYIVTLNGKKYEVNVTETEAAITSVAPVEASGAVPAPAQVAAPVPAPAPANEPVPGRQVKSPMPGNILSVKVSVGSRVNAGDVLFILEAMKMENEIVSPVAGTVRQLLAEKGSVVETDAVLAVIEGGANG